MNLLKCILTNNLCYKAGKTIIPKGVMVHSTGANNPNIKRYVQPLDHDVPGAYDPDRETLMKFLGKNQYNNDWNHTDRKAGVHAFIGKLADGSIASVQTLPWDHRGWHAGSGTKGSANNTHVSFEICEDGLTDPVYFKKAKDEAVALTTMLCKMYNLDPMADGVIICHQDGYKRGVACNHSDIYNWWPKHNYTMDDFRSEVFSAMTDNDQDPDLNSDQDTRELVFYKTINSVPDYYRPSIGKLIAKGVLIGTEDGIIDVSEDMCRIMTVLDRMGKLD